MQFEPTKGFWIFSLILILLVLAIALIPSFIAYKRDHKYKFIILLINVFIGATGIGYLVALVWSLWPDSSEVKLQIKRDGVTYGPYPISSVISFLQSGNFKYEDLCWYKGAYSWRTIADVAHVLGIPPKP